MISARGISHSIIFTYLRTMALVVCLWWAVSLWLARPYLLPPPETVATAAFKLLTTGKVAAAIAVSGQRLLLSYLMAAGIGVPMGVGMGLSRWMADLFDWLVEMIRPISGIAWIPVLLVVFGVSNALPTGSHLKGHAPEKQYARDWIASSLAFLRSKRKADFGRDSAECVMGRPRRRPIAPAFLPHLLPARSSLPWRVSLPGSVRGVRQRITIRPGHVAQIPPAEEVCGAPDRMPYGGLGHRAYRRGFPSLSGPRFAAASQHSLASNL